MINGMNISNMHNGGVGQKQAGAGKALKVLAISPENAAPGTPNGDAANTGVPAAAGSGITLFQQVYNEIAESNKIAQNKNGAKNATESDTATSTGSSDQDTDMEALAGSELLKQLGLVQGVAPQVTDIQQLLTGIQASTSPSDLSAQAAALIRDAIATITKTLNLKVQDGLENLSSITPTKAIVNQFAEMLSTLKGIAGVLDDSVKLNQPLEYKNLAFDVPSAANVQQVLREQMFKIEIGLKMMGISGDVSAAVAQKDDAAQAAVATLSGIPQASDPSKLAMPAIHVNQVLGDLFASKEQKVETLLTKLAETLKKNGSPEANTAALLTKIASAAEGTGSSATAVQDATADATASATASTTANTAVNAASSEIMDIGSLDSQVLRKILKVDPDQATEAQNKIAQQAEVTKSAELATMSENKNAAQQNIALGLPKDGQVATSKTIADALAIHKPDEASTQAVPGGQNAASPASDKLMSTIHTNETGTMRQIEESVIQQVAEKLNVAVKTGITEIRVLLHPDSLGDVQIKIKVEGDVVTGKMYVESQQVKHIVEANLQTLKNSLMSHHNLSVGSFSVDVNHDNGSSGQMRDLADMGTKNGNGNSNSNSSKEGVDETENIDGSSKTFVSGIDTGRKFGTNTIEYFA
jgi:flagellar hook-length control protein FliK